MKNTYIAFLAAAALAFSGSVLAKEKDVNIASDTSGLTAETSQTLARTALAMGVREPMNISKSGDSAKISGANATVCTIKLAGENIQGVSCK